MDENTKIIKEGLDKVAKQNRENNELLKEANKRTTLKKSIDDNKGEILVTAAMGALESRVDKSIAKGHNLGVGVMAKSGVDIVPGGEPAVDEKETLYGITKEFYGRFNFSNLIELAKQNLKTNDKVLEGFQSLNKSTKKNNKEQLSLFQKIIKFIDPSEENPSIGAGFRSGTGITKLRTLLSDKLGGILKSFKGFPFMIGRAIAVPFRLIGQGLKKLGSTLLKPLNSMLNTLIRLPGKILGFFGGALSILGRLALLGGGIFALSKLTDYLRGVGPGGQESFVDTLMFAFEKVKELFKFLGNVIEQTVIPMMIALGNAIYQTIAFLSNFIPGISLGTGEAAAAEKRIREKYKGPVEDPMSDVPDTFLDEKGKEAFIQKEIEKDREKRFKKGLDTYLRTFLNPFGKSVQELTDEYREKFLFDEGKNLKIGDTMVTGPGSALEKNLKEYGDIIKGIPEKKGEGVNAMIGSGNVSSVNANYNNYSSAHKQFLVSNDVYNLQPE